MIAQAHRFQAVHSTLFVGGTVAILIGLVWSPELLLVGGICVALSGLMSWAGLEVSFHGRLGGMLRRVLGARRVLNSRIVATMWVLFGLVIAIVAAYDLSSRTEGTPPAQGPHYAAERSTATPVASPDPSPLPVRLACPSTSQGFRLARKYSQYSLTRRKPL